MAQIAELTPLDASAQQRSHNSSARARWLKPTNHQEILALIPRLTRYARVLTRDNAAADDLVQDCLARALGKIHLWEPESDLRAWLFTILHHQHISHTRQIARQRAKLQSQNSHPSLTLSPNQTIRLELRDLERAMAKLPEEQRSVVLLVGLAGMAYEEAAAVVNLPVGTVRSRVARGREALRTMTELFPPRHSQRPRRGRSVDCDAAPGAAQEWGPRTDRISAQQLQEVV